MTLITMTPSISVFSVDTKLAQRLRGKQNFAPIVSAQLLKKISYTLIGVLLCPLP